jgi:hypothetical protein
MKWNLDEFDLTHETVRSYTWINQHGHEHTVEIYSPQKLFKRVGGSTHRVLDNEGNIHCVPAPEKFGCVLRWRSCDTNNPCEF